MANKETEFICSVRESVINTGKTLLKAQQTDGIIVLKADDTEDLVIVIHDVDAKSEDFAGSVGLTEVDPDAVAQMCSIQIQTAAKLKDITKYHLKIDGIIVFKGNQQKQKIVKLHEVIRDKQTKDMNKSDKSLSETNKKRKRTDVQQYSNEFKHLTLPSNINQNDQKMNTLPSNGSKDAKVKNKMILSQPPQVKYQQNVPLDITSDSSKGLKVESKKILSGSSTVKQQNTSKKTPPDVNASKTVQIENKRMLSQHTAAHYQQKPQVKGIHGNIIQKHCKDQVGQALVTSPSSDPSTLKNEMLSMKNDAYKSQTLPLTTERTVESPRKPEDGKESHEVFNLNSLSIEYYASKKLEICKTTNIPCDKCGKVSETILLLEVHHSIAHQLSTCLVCAKTVANKKSLTRHIQCKHLEPGFECQLCKKKFHEKYALRKHLITHANKLKKMSTQVSGASGKGTIVKTKTKTHTPKTIHKWFKVQKSKKRQHSGNSSSYNKPSNNPQKDRDVIGQTHTSLKETIHTPKPHNNATTGNNGALSEMLHPVYTQETQYQELNDNKMKAPDNGNKKIKIGDHYNSQYDTSTNLDGDDETVTCGHCNMSFMSSKYLEVHLKRQPDHKL